MEAAKTGISFFIDHPEIQKLTEQAQAIRADPNAIFSDIIDNEGNQYVDLVQEGGGVLGIALLGYTYIMEEAGIRFYDLAGTSAGAINTLLLASIGRLDTPKSIAGLEALANTNLFDFVDGNPKIKKTMQLLIEGKEGKAKVRLALQGYRILRLLQSRLGLNPGAVFMQWLEKILQENGVTTTQELSDKRINPEGFRDRKGNAIDSKPRWVVIASDVTTKTKVQFPAMGGLYVDRPDLESPARWVRASMSVPFFFEPVRFSGLPAGSQAEERWWELARYRGPIPPQVEMVDGGMLSNFPINVFHRKKGVPRRPTFGVRLSSYREGFGNSQKLFPFLGSMVSTMRQIHDLDFLLRNEDYSHLICRLDVDQKFHWLNFNMSDEEKRSLFQYGAEGALKFLQSFDWNGYKEIRRKLSS